MLIDPWKNQGKHAFLHYRSGLVESNGNPTPLQTQHAYYLAFDGKKMRVYESLDGVPRQNVLGVISFDGDEAARNLGIIAPLYGNCTFVNGKDRIVNGQRMFVLNEPIELKSPARPETIIIAATEDARSKLDDMIRMHDAMARMKYTPRSKR